MIRLRDLLCSAWAPLAKRHMLVEGHVPLVLTSAAATVTAIHAAPAVQPRRVDARVVRLFAVQIR
jgi:transketolase C-terminal domain/subunit